MVSCGSPFTSCHGPDRSLLATKVHPEAGQADCHPKNELLQFLRL